MQDTLMASKVQLPPQGYVAVLAAGTRTGAQTKPLVWAAPTGSREVSFDTTMFSSASQMETEN